MLWRHPRGNTELKALEKIILTRAGHIELLIVDSFYVYQCRKSSFGNTQQETNTFTVQLLSPSARENNTLDIKLDVTKDYIKKCWQQKRFWVLISRLQLDFMLLIIEDQKELGSTNVVCVLKNKRYNL